MKRTTNLALFLLCLFLINMQVFAQGQERDETCRAFFITAINLDAGKAIGTRISGNNLLSSKSCVVGNILSLTNGSYLQNDTARGNSLLGGVAMHYSSKKWGFKLSYRFINSYSISFENERPYFYNGREVKGYELDMDMKGFSLDIQRFFKLGRYTNLYFQTGANYIIPTQISDLSFVNDTGTGGEFKNVRLNNIITITPEFGLRFPYCFRGAFMDLGFYYSFNPTSTNLVDMDYHSYENNELSSSSKITSKGGSFGLSMDWILPIVPIDKMWNDDACPTKIKGNKTYSDKQKEKIERYKPTKVGNGEIIQVKAITLTIEVADWEKKDGDIISVFFNGQKYLDKVNINKRQKFVIYLNADTKSNELTILAHNEGKISPNTPVITFFDGTRQRYLELQAKTNSTTSIKFEYNPNR